MTFEGKYYTRMERAALAAILLLPALPAVAGWVMLVYLLCWRP